MPVFRLSAVVAMGENEDGSSFSPPSFLLVTSWPLCSMGGGGGVVGGNGGQWWLWVDVGGAGLLCSPFDIWCSSLFPVSPPRVTVGG